MEDKDEILRRVFAPPTPEELERRRKAAADIRSIRVDISPMTLTELRQLAREDQVYEDDDTPG